MAETAAQTLSLLERRVARVSFYLQGQNLPIGESETSGNGHAKVVSVASKLSQLQGQLSELCAKNPQAAELLRLHAQAPDIFAGSTTSLDDTRVQPAHTGHVPAILSSEPMFPATASLLTSLEAQSVPEASSLIDLIALQPRLDRAMAVQRSQVEELQDLRRRSTAVLTQWYQKTVLQGGHEWADWEERLATVELVVRRRENAQSREDQEI